MVRIEEYIFHIHDQATCTITGLQDLIELCEQPLPQLFLLLFGGLGLLFGGLGLCLCGLGLCGEGLLLLQSRLLSGLGLLHCLQCLGLGLLGRLTLLFGLLRGLFRLESLLTRILGTALFD